MSDAVPFETTLTLQNVVQMRDAADLDFIDTFAPSTRLEGELGFDLEIRNLKGVVFQFKRPKTGDGGKRRFSVRYSDDEPPRQLDKVKNYAVKYGDQTAYYALPLVTKHDDLEIVLEWTAFVNALAIPDNASVIHIPEQYCRNGERQSSEPLDVYCSQPMDTDHNWWDSIDASAVLGWNELYKQITECTIGFKIRSQGNSWQDKYHDDHRYFPQSDEAQWNSFDIDELFGLTQESGPLITRFGSDDDVFSSS